jgi:nucleoid-associated protein YgaU
MNVPVEELSEPKFSLSVEKEPWKRVESLESSGPDDLVFTVDRKTGTIRFGDGINGRKPTAESSISATYEFGGGANGNVGNEPIITLKWTLPSQQMNQIIGAIIEHQDDGIIFRVCREFENPHRWKWVSTHCKNIMSECADRRISGGLSISDMLLGKIKRALPRKGCDNNEDVAKHKKRAYIVKENDTLQSMIENAYYDSNYCMEVAKINDLENFRKLEVGTVIIFPPLDKPDS